MNRQKLYIAILCWIGGFLLASTPGFSQLLSKKKGNPEGKKMASEELMADGMRFVMKGEPAQALPVFEALIHAEPAEPSGYYMHAKVLNELKKYDQAIVSAKKAFDADPANATYGVFLAELYNSQKLYAEVVPVYESLLKLEPGNVNFGIEMAAAYIFTGQFEKAISTYDNLEKVMGVAEEITRQKQQLYLRQNKLEEAIGESYKLINADPGDSQHYVELAELLIANERIDEAMKPLEESVRLNPDEAQAHVLLADIYRRKGDLKRCNEELKIVFSNHNLDAEPKVRVLTGYISMLKSKEEKEDALNLSRLLVETHPDDARSMVIYADLLARNGEKENARDVYVKASKLDPSIYEIWAAILQLDGELNQIDSLMVHSDQALEVFPNQGLLWYSNGTANLIKKNYSRAIESFEECLNLTTDHPDLVRAVNAQLGDAYNAKGDHGKSDEYYEKVLKEDPDNDHVLNNYSYFLSMRKENLDKALSMSTRLVGKHQNNATYLDTHAWVLYVRKEYNEARKFLEKAILDTANVNGTIIEHYGDVLFKLGQKDRALEQWKKARSKGETSDIINRKIETGILHEK